jgi:hypothetical protein
MYTRLLLYRVDVVFMLEMSQLMSKDTGKLIIVIPDQFQNPFEDDDIPIWQS